MNCYACDQPATNACKRCAKPYCEDHGNARYCADCLQPSSALPSFNLYRGALLAMLAGTALAVFLIVRPPGESSGTAPVIVGGTSATATPPGGTPQATVAAETPVATTTSAASPTPSSTEAAILVYEVQPGDSLFSIAADHLPPGDDLAEFANAIANLNGITTDTILSVGQKLALPPEPD